jgi:hypothetical protein
VTVAWPHWWDWELELTPHIEKRMEDRDFTEVDLRAMLENATSIRPDVVEGRWIVQAQHGRRSWEILVEPDEDEQLIVAITAYTVGEA